MSKYRRMLGNMQFIKAICIEELIKNKAMNSKEIAVILTKEIGIEFESSEVIQILSLFPKEFELAGFNDSGSIWCLTKSAVLKVGLFDEIEN